jgi:hypothetical protein
MSLLQSISGMYVRTYFRSHFNCFQRLFAEGKVVYVHFFVIRISVLKFIKIGISVNV